VIQNNFIQVGEQTIKALTGGYIFILTGVIQSYSNDEDKPAKFLVIISPGEFEKYFDELIKSTQNETD
jgi:quercetin dioxygenase-like cupin family protein